MFVYIHCLSTDLAVTGLVGLAYKFGVDKLLILWQ